MQVQGAFLQVLEHPPGRTHHNMGAMLQRADLGTNGHTATQSRHLRIGQMLGQLTKALRDLFRQFPGRTKHQCLNMKLCVFQTL